MRFVVADTTLLNYLILIGCIDVLPQIVDRVSIPSIVRDELLRSAAPPKVRNWIATPPAWLDIVDCVSRNLFDEFLDPGEATAISLAELLNADGLLMDDRAGVMIARARGLRVIGTMGLLDAAAARELIDLPTAFELLRQTTFHYPRALMDELLLANRRRSVRAEFLPRQMGSTLLQNPTHHSKTQTNPNHTKY